MDGAAGRLYSPWGHKESDTTERLHFLSPHEILTFSQYEPKKKEPQLRKTGSPFPSNHHSLCLDPELTRSGVFRYVKEQLLVVLEPQIWLGKRGSWDCEERKQWLRLRASNTGGMDLILGQGTKIPHAAPCSQKKKKKNQFKNQEKKQRRNFELGMRLKRQCNLGWIYF